MANRGSHYEISNQPAWAIGAARAGSRPPRKASRLAPRSESRALAAMPATNPAVSLPHFCYHRPMTIGIAGPGRKAPGRSAVAGFIIAACVVGICLILLGLASDFLVDWLWFSSIGYPQVFLTTIGAKAHGLFHRFHGDRRHPLAERIACGALCRAAAGTERSPLRPGACGRYVAARSVGVPARSTAVARACRAQRGCARSARRRGRSRQLGHLPAVSLSGAIRRRRSALRQGHRLLSLFPARLYRDQELDAADDRRSARCSPERSTGCTATSNTTFSTDRCRRQRLLTARRWPVFSSR